MENIITLPQDATITYELAKDFKFITFFVNPQSSYRISESKNFYKIEGYLLNITIYIRKDHVAIEEIKRTIANSAANTSTIGTSKISDTVDNVTEKDVVCQLDEIVFKYVGSTLLKEIIKKEYNAAIEKGKAIRSNEFRKLLHLGEIQL